MGLELNLCNNHMHASDAFGKLSVPPHLPSDRVGIAEHVGVRYYARIKKCLQTCQAVGN